MERRSRNAAFALLFHDWQCAVNPIRGPITTSTDAVGCCDQCFVTKYISAPQKSGERSALSRRPLSALQKFNMVREVAEIPSLLSHSTTGNVPVTRPGAQYLTSALSQSPCSAPQKSGEKSALSLSPSSTPHKQREVAEVLPLLSHSMIGNMPLTPPGAQFLHRQVL